MIQLRLLAGVFRLVLTGEAPELVRFYPCLVPRSLSLFTVRAAQAPPRGVRMPSSAQFTLGRLRSWPGRAAI
jgi:hypothetical protein